MGAAHAALLAGHADSATPPPPVRGTHRDIKVSFQHAPDAPPQPPVHKPAAARIPGHDFAAWDRYDVDSALNELDADSKAPPPPPAVGAAAQPSAPKILPASRVAHVPHTAREREQLARTEKDKGNECYQAGDLEEAVLYYTRSIGVVESAAALNNRALAYLRLKRWAPAVADCDRVLAIEAGNTKALVRRATARRALKDYGGARADAEAVLKVEPGNKDALSVLKGLPDTATSVNAGAPAEPTPPIAAAEPRRRIVIQEVEDDDEDDDDEAETAPSVLAEAAAPPVMPSAVVKAEPATLPAEPVTEPIPVPASAAKPAPPRVEESKTKGNQAYACGDYAEAKMQYTHALTRLDQEPDAADFAILRASLLSNRAVSHIKLGDAASTMADCTLSLQLDPGNTKSLLRRAAALEMRERYQAALDDYRAVLRVHSTNAAALDGVNRTSRALRSLGPDAKSSAGSPAPVPQVESAKPPPSKAAQYETWKNRGNEYVKQGDFATAIECYKQCVAVDPTLAFAFNNRAHCHLKLGHFDAAVVDTTTVLGLERDNVKALYRRAQARIGLEQWVLAQEDLSAVLALDPANAPASADLAKVKAKAAAQAAAKSAEPSRRVRIEEIDDEPVQAAPKPPTAASQAKAAVAAASPIKLAAPLPTKAPTAPLEFIRLFAAFKGNDAGLAAALKLVKPADLPRLFSNQLEADHLGAVARALNHPSIADQPIGEYAAALAKAARFDLAKMLLEDGDKQHVRELIATVGKTDAAAAKRLQAQYL